jgi:hypothetical protein
MHSKWLEMFRVVLEQLDKKLEDSKARKSIALNISNTISRKFNYPFFFDGLHFTSAADCVKS